MAVEKENVVWIAAATDKEVKELYTRIYDVIDMYDQVLTNAAVLGVLTHITYRINKELDKEH